jgi:predicted RNA-binding protein with PIN domain
MAGRKKPLLLVDGYNVLRATGRYEHLMAEGNDRVVVTAGGSGRSAGGGAISGDPFERAREALVADVAAFAQGSYEAVIVYDGARNLSPDRPELRPAGVRVVFSEQGESADTVIERLSAQARRAGREVALVTSDNAIRSTAGTGPFASSVTKISSANLVQELEATDREVAHELDRRTHAKMTVEDRLSPETRAKLNSLLGRTN